MKTTGKLKTPAKFMIATKLGMTQMYGETGVMTPVTLLLAGQNVVTQLKTKEKEEREAKWQPFLKPDC